MPEESAIVIIGGGLAGCAAASMLANAGRAREVTIFESDGDAPYDRPPLTKTFLAQSDTLSAWPAWAPMDVVWRRECVSRVDVRNRTLTTSTGAKISADAVVLTTGARPRRLSGRPERVITVRTAADVRSLRRIVLGGGSNFLIEGAGPLGLEIASTLAAAGATVTVVDIASKPMIRLAGGSLSDEVLSWASEAGVRILLGTSVTNVRVGEGPHGVIAGIGGQRDEAYDAMISAVGVDRSTLSVCDGETRLDSPLITDVHGHVLDAAGVPIAGVYAAGDATGLLLQNGRVIRSESWTAARIQGEAVARHLLGKGEVTTQPPYFWTRVFGRMIQIVGDMSGQPSLELVAEVPKVGGSLFRATVDGVQVGYVGVNAQRYMAHLQTQSGDPAQWAIPRV